MGKWNKIQHTRDELLDYIKLYRSRDQAPNYIRHLVNKEFGGWTKGLEAANVTGRIGGTFDENKPATLYLLDFGEFQKIGVTQTTIRQRFKGSPPYKVLDSYTSDALHVLALEREIKAKIVPFDPNLAWFERNGKGECFQTFLTKLEDFC